MATVVCWAIKDTTRQAITFARMIQEHEEDYGSDNDNIEIESEEENTIIPPIYQKQPEFARRFSVLAK